MKKILILVGDCVEDSQIDFPSRTLQVLGHKVDIASPNKKEGDFITSSIFEPSSLQYFNPVIVTNTMSLLILILSITKVTMSYIYQEAIHHFICI